MMNNSIINWRIMSFESKQRYVIMSYSDEKIIFTRLVQILTKRLSISQLTVYYILMWQITNLLRSINLRLPLIFFISNQFLVKIILHGFFSFTSKGLSIVYKKKAEIDMSNNTIDMDGALILVSHCYLSGHIKDFTFVKSCNFAIFLD